MADDEFQVVEHKHQVNNHGKITRVLAISLKDGSAMTADDLRRVHEMIAERRPDGLFYMKAFGSTPFPFTLKTWAGDFSLATMEDYMEGHSVANLDKFTDEFFQVHIGYEMAV